MRFHPPGTRLAQVADVAPAVRCLIGEGLCCPASLSDSFSEKKRWRRREARRLRLKVGSGS